MDYKSPRPRNTVFVACRIPSSMLLHELGSISTRCRQVSPRECRSLSVYASHVRVRYHERQPAGTLRVEWWRYGVVQRNVSIQTGKCRCIVCSRGIKMSNNVVWSTRPIVIPLRSISIQWFLRANFRSVNSKLQCSALWTNNFVWLTIKCIGYGIWTTEFQLDCLDNF